MSAVSDFSLFPNKEEWGSGDEAMDNRLSVAMKKVKDDLTLSNIHEFYLYGLSLKPRAYNPSFHTTIELVIKAFLFCLDPEGFNDQMIQKMKGDYGHKKKINFELSESKSILDELKSQKNFRYRGQIDFYMHPQDTQERNPFIRAPLKRFPFDLHVKIIMKDFKMWLNGEKELSKAQDPFFRKLKEGDILVIHDFAEIWFHEGTIFILPLFTTP